MKKMNDGIYNPKRAAKGFVKLQDILPVIIDKIEYNLNFKKSDSGISTGFQSFDKLSNGLKSGNLVVIAAHQSMGKTTLALNMARHIAVELREPVGFYSLGVSRELITERILYNQANFNIQKIQRGEMVTEDWPKLVKAIGPLCESELYINDSTNISLTELKADIYSLKSKKELKVIFVDNLQLISAHNKNNLEADLAFVCRALKELALELDITVVALSRLNTNGVYLDDRLPVLSDLPEEIEPSADLVVLIHRNTDIAKISENISELIVAKNRNGQTGSFRLYFMDQFLKFANIADMANNFAFSEKEI